MDFGQLLHTAQKNEKTNKNGARYYSTKFEPPKKEKKGKELSENIKKFLAKKEAEERRKAEEDRKKRDELLALRSQDKKATRRVNVMLKRTKSANQSVIEDAVDNDNTAVTLAGPMQPDEDDYGYVSQEASAFYNKMMEKYSKMPDEPKFNLTKKKVSTNLTSTKDRVKAALEKEREEAMQPHRRKRKHKDKERKEGEDDEEGISFKAPDREVDTAAAMPPPPPPKPKPKPAPPPMNFAELLKIAEKKQFEPIIIEKKEKEEEKLLTKKQRKEMEKERDYLQRKEARKEAGGRPPPPPPDRNRIPKLSERSTTTPTSEKSGYPNTNDRVDKIPKLSGQRPMKPSTDDHIPKPNGLLPSAKPSINKPSSSISSKDVPRKPPPANLDRNERPVATSSRGSTNVFPSKSSNSSIPSNSNFKLSSKDQEKVRHLNSNTNNLKDGRPKPLTNTFNSKPKDFPPKDLKPKKLPSEGLQPKMSPKNDIQPKNLPSSDVKARKYLPGDLRAKQFPPKDMKPKQFPPADVRRKELPPDMRRKEFPPPDVRRKEFPPADVRRKEFPPPGVQRRELPPGGLKKKPAIGTKRRILDDDDSEYDSEMDDFIDDDEPESDYSKYISEIFGYDKSKYRDVDEDVDNMESTFAQQMKEEVISTKLGIMEDLEDMKKEEEEKKRKALMKKKRKL